MKLEDIDQIRLWVDDVRPAPPEYNMIVDNALDAIIFLSSGGVVEISLDHDLGDDISAGTGYLVAKYIEEQAYTGKLPRLTWHIHSDNAVGRRNIEMALKNADRFWNRADKSGLSED